MTDASAKVKDAAFSQFPRKHEGRDYMGYAMRTDRYRYVEWLDAVSGDVVFWELYDHQNDTAENEIPFVYRYNLPEAAQRIFRSVYNAELQQHGSRRNEGLARPTRSARSRDRIEIEFARDRASRRIMLADEARMNFTERSDNGFRPET